MRGIVLTVWFITIITTFLLTGCTGRLETVSASTLDQQDVRATPAQDYETEVSIIRVIPPASSRPADSQEESPFANIKLDNSKKDLPYVIAPAGFVIYSLPSESSPILYTTEQTTRLVWDVNNAEVDEMGDLWVRVITPDDQSGWLKIQ